MEPSELAALTTATIGVLGAVCALILWVARQIMHLGAMVAQVNQLSEEIKHSSKVTEEQVSNTHSTNLRDDITELKADMVDVKESVARMAEKYNKLWFIP